MRVQTLNASANETVLGGFAEEEESETDAVVVLTAAIYNHGREMVKPYRP